MDIFGGLFDEEPEETSTSNEEPQDDSVESDPDVIAATAAILNAEAILAEHEKEISDAFNEKKILDEEIRAMEQRMQELKRQQAEVVQRGVFIRSSEAIQKREKEAAERKLALAREAYYSRQRIAETFTEMEELVKDKVYWTGVDGKRILDHQWFGAKFLATSGGAILGDGMGLGKTLTSIAALDLVRSRRALILCQADIASNFEREIRRWAPHRMVMNIQGKTKMQRNTALEFMHLLDGDVVVIANYEAWRRDKSLLGRLADVGFDTVILDEAHNVKTTSTNAYQGAQYICAVENVCPFCQALLPTHQINGQYMNEVMRTCKECKWQGTTYAGAIPEIAEIENREERKRAHYYRVRSVKNVWNVTGTPILNKPEDLYALLSLCDPINFKVKKRFLEDYCYFDLKLNRYTFTDGGLEYLTKHQLKGRFLARTYQDAGIVLPPQDITYHDIELDQEVYARQFEVIEQLEKHAEIVLNSGAKLPQMVEIALLTRQRQANVWPGGIQWDEVDENGIPTGRVIKVAEDCRESVKMDKAIEIMSEAVSAGRRVVLFSQFRTTLEELHERINGMVLDDGKVVRSTRFDGSTPKEEKESIKLNWDKSNGEEAKHDVLLANYKVGGTGLNLTAATVTIILDEEWNPGKRDQAYARNHRMGQDEQTIIHVLRIKKTVDTWLAKLIEGKEQMIQGFSGAALDMQAEWKKAFENGELGIGK
ncbi:RNA polymerase-associated protein [Cellulosimicrobium phage DS1]|nr:RNA polymerase-associated protein [Cellulosimicrobium phage DS1]